MDECMNFYMRKANRVLNKIYDGHLQTANLSAGQFTILRVIDHMQQTTNRELQDLMAMDQSTLTRNLKPLLRDGYIVTSTGEDRRVKLLSLSPGGQRKFKEGIRLWKRAQNEVRKKLGARESARLLQIASEVAALRN